MKKTLIAAISLVCFALYGCEKSPDSYGYFQIKNYCGVVVKVSLSNQAGRNNIFKETVEYGELLTKEVDIGVYHLSVSGDELPWGYLGEVQIKPQEIVKFEIYEDGVRPIK